MLSLILQDEIIVIDGQIDTDLLVASIVFYML